MTKVVGGLKSASLVSNYATWVYRPRLPSTSSGAGAVHSTFRTTMDDRPPNLTSRAEPAASSVNAETATATHLTFSQSLQTVQEPDVSRYRL